MASFLKDFLQMSQNCRGPLKEVITLTDRYVRVPLVIVVITISSFPSDSLEIKRRFLAILVVIRVEPLNLDAMAALISKAFFVVALTLSLGKKSLGFKK